MPRIARVVAPSMPHHITQRGNRRQQTFFSPDDYHEYLCLMAEWCAKCDVQIWAYCLMPNHVHLIAVPKSGEGFRRGIGEAHRRYTRHVNFREGWRGHLWQGRFTSYPMDNTYLLAAARYIETNPVRAGLCQKPEDYPWSSAQAHLAGRDDVLVRVDPMGEMVQDWKQFLSLDGDPQVVNRLRLHERTGRPLGDQPFISNLEKILGLTLRKKKPGPKKKEK